MKGTMPVNPLDKEFSPKDNTGKKSENKKAEILYISKTHTLT